MNKYFGITLVVLAVALAVVPSFTDCASQGLYTTQMGKQVPMKCHWTATSEIAVGAPLFGVGAMMFFTRRKGGFFSLYALAGILGVMAILLPTEIVGTCALASHNCNTVMKPAIFAVGGLTIAGSLAGLLWARKATW